jgi:hypothetical protein
MSNYQTGKVVTTNFLGEFLHNKHTQKYINYARCSDCAGSGWWDYKGPFHLRASASWKEQGDLAYWTSVYPNLEHFQAEVEDVSSKIERLKTEAWGEVLNAYSLGSELGELGQTLRFVSELIHTVKHPIKSFMKARDQMIRNFKRKGIKMGSLDAANELSGLWLQYRYAFMPLVYSVQDVMKLLDGNPTFVTARRKVGAEISFPDLPEKSTYLYDEFVGSVEYRITVKGTWKVNSNSDRIDINPITTAWELIPLSFVVDWFVNVGDFLQSYVRNLTSSADVIGCVVKSEQITKRTYLHLYKDERNVYTRGDSSASCMGNAINLPALERTMGDERSESILLREVVTQSYDRKVFSSDDLELTLSPFLTWKRLLDGLALSLGTATSALRRL